MIYLNTIPGLQNRIVEYDKRSVGYFNPAHLEAHCAYIYKNTIPALNNLEEASLHQVYLDRYGKLKPNPLMRPLGMYALFACSPHAFFCSMFSGYSSQCNCVKVDPFDFDLVDLPTVTACIHKPAKDPLFHKGKFWTYCKHCGDWLKEWSPNKK